MNILQFPTAPVPDLASDEERRGAELTKALLSLTDPGVGARIEASSITDLLREANGVYWEDGRPPAGVAASMVSFATALPFLSDDRIDYWMSLVRFAVQVEMKHWVDYEYALHAGAAYEVLVSMHDYYDYDEDRFDASLDNRAYWAALAEIATAHALAENALAFSQAA